MMKVLWVVAFVACVTPATETCDDGLVCPAGTRCVSAVIDEDETMNLCVEPDQLGICSGGDRVACLYGERVGTCHGGACIPDECGNRLHDVTEACDDGNNASTDNCSADCTSTQVCGNQIVDSITGEQCDLMDSIGHDGCASSCRLEAPLWSPYLNLPARYLTALTFDGVRGHVIAVGGTDVAFDALTDTRQWNGRRWETLVFPLAPTAVNEQKLEYDAARRNVVLFGGTSPATWTLDATGWRVADTNTAPPSRGAFGMTYDAKLQRVVAFGGVHTVGTVALLGDTWAWDGSNWTEITGPGPEPRYGHAMAFDRKRGVVVVFGGITQNLVSGETSTFGDIWELDGSTWTKKTFTGGPSPRVVTAATWNPVTQRVLVVGGRSDLTSAPTYYKDAWEWDGVGWTPMAAVPASGAADVSGHALATDFARARVVLHGTNSDTYEFDGTSWTPRAETPIATSPARVNALAALDPVHREVVVVGGTTDGFGQTFATTTLIWSGEWLAGPTVNQPANRERGGLVYDPIRDEMVLFGGAGPTSRGDTHVYRHRATRTWTPLTPAMSPSARQDLSMAWDGVRGRVLLFGGFGTNFLDDTWSWDGTTWAKDTPATSPPKRIRAPMVYDPVGKRTILVGGISETGRLLDDTWAWDGTTWKDISGQVRPPPRELGALAFDAGRGHVVLVAGNADGAILSDAWELVGNTWELAPALIAPAPRLGHSLVSAPEGSGLWMFGGITQFDQPPLPEVWRFHWGAPFVAQEMCTDVDTDGDALAGCADPDCTFLCAPTCVPREMGCTSTARCGDGVCEPARETCVLCPGDCGACKGP